MMLVLVTVGSVRGPSFFFFPTARPGVDDHITTALADVNWLGRTSVWGLCDSGSKLPGTAGLQPCSVTDCWPPMG